MNKYEEQAAKVETNYRRGVIVDDERRQQEIEIWTNANKEVGDATDRAMNAIANNPIRMMVDSGARGNSQQIRQIAAMKGLVSNPRGEMIPRPIKSSFREGLSVLEYFISTHGTRKGLGDTALRTADSGYLTRRLVDVAQELIVKEFDCNTSRGMWIEHVTADTRGQRSHLETKLWGRVLSEDVTLSDGATISAGTMLMQDDVDRLRDDGADRVRVQQRSRVTRSKASVRRVTDSLSPRTNSSSSVKRSESSQPSPLVNREPSSPCVPSTQVV